MYSTVFTPFTNQTGRHKLKRDGDRFELLIEDVQPEDAGDYTCEVVNEAGRRTCYAPLQVHGTLTRTCTVHDLSCNNIS